MKLQYTPSPLTGEWYTTALIMSILGVKSSRVAALARIHKWPRRMVGRSALYDAGDVGAYLDARERRNLFAALGEESHSLVWHDHNDVPCPICGTLAIALNNRWRCAGGHEGETEMMNDEITTIFFGVMSADLLDSDAARFYSEALSAAGFARAVVEALEASYPGASINYEIAPGISGAVPTNLKTRVNGEIYHEETPLVDDIIGQVFERFSWLRQ